MATIIDRTYFVSPLVIPQIEEASVQAELASLIQGYEEEYLNSLLGYALAKLVRSFINTDPEPTTQQRIKDLIEGKEFVDRFGNDQKWYGFRYTLGTTKKSPIANYVYMKLLRERATYFGSQGEVQLKTENSNPASSIDRQVRVWNDMVDAHRILYEFLYANQDSYEEYFSSGLYPYYSSKVDLYSKINPLNL